MNKIQDENSTIDSIIISIYCIIISTVRIDSYIIKMDNLIDNKING